MTAPALAYNVRRRPARPTRRVISFPGMVQRIADRFGVTAATAWTKTVVKYQAEINETALRSAIISGNINAIEAAIGPAALQQRLAQSIEAPLLAASQVTGAQSARILTQSGIGASFNAVHPNVVLFARQQAAELVVGIPRETKQIIAEVIARGAEGRLTVADQARAIREVVGLPPQWAKAPTALATELRAGRAGAATSRKMSAALKQRIRSAVANDRVTDAFVRSVTAEYAQTLVNLRARTIARTESLRASNFGLGESWRQAQDSGALPMSARRMWIVTPDDRMCIICMRIPEMNPDGRRLDEMFMTPEGLVQTPPAPHPNCRCAIGLVFTGGANALDQPLSSIVQTPLVSGAPVPFNEAITALPKLTEGQLNILEDVGVSIDSGAIYRKNPFLPVDFLGGEQGVQMGALDPFLSERLTPAQFERVTQYMDRPTDLPYQRVKLNSLASTQPFVVDVPLRAMTAAPATAVREGTPLVLRVNGQNIIIDGNHRLTVELLRGQTTARVRYLDVDQFSGGRTILSAVPDQPLPSIEHTPGSRLVEVYGNDAVSAFERALGMRELDISSNTVWQYLPTPKGDATVRLQNEYFKNQVKIHWLVAEKPGAGRAAMDIMTSAADLHGITLTLDAVPLARAAGNTGPAITKKWLESYYKRFGFKVESRDAGGYARMVRKPSATPRLLRVTPKGTGVTAGLDPAVAQAVERVLTDLGVDPSAVVYKDLGRAKGSIKGVVAGEYKNGKIYLQPNASRAALAQTAAHEAEHLRFKVALYQDKKLKFDILDDWKGLSADDGVTAYSRAHWGKSELWEGMDLGPRPVWMKMLVVNETLAEIRAMSVVGRAVGSARYKKLQARVNRAYSAWKKAGSRRLPFGGPMQRVQAARPLTVSEKSALRAYQIGGNQDTNSLLRQGYAYWIDRAEARELQRGVSSQGLRVSITRTANDVRKQAALLDAAIEKSAPLQKELTVWRGGKFPDVKVGQQFTDKAFVSTTTDKAVAEDFGRYSWVMQIKLHPGQKMVRIRGHGSYKESELLLPRGTKFRVVGIRNIGTHIGKLIDLEVVS